MSVRYGIALALDPAFTSRVYRSRQLICGQYASWAAEMNMVYVPLTGFFQCSDAAVAQVDTGLAATAAQSRQQEAQFHLSHSGVGTLFDRAGDGAGHIFLDFALPESNAALTNLQGSVADLLERTAEVAAEPGNENRPHLPLMLYARLPEPVFNDAVEFARAVVADIQVPSSTRAWRLLLLRFESDAAGDDWSKGRWAADLRWELLSSHGL